MEKWPLGVFASIDAGLGVKLEVASQLGVPTVHLHSPHRESRTPERADEFLGRLSELGIHISVVFAGFEGESYADIPTVHRTCGLVPRQPRAERLVELKEIADFAHLLGVKAVGLHLGAIPDDPNDAEYRSVVAVTAEVCDYIGRNGQNLHLETGQEKADTLLGFLNSVGRDNLFINFDPANMILYGAGNPIEALRKVGHRVRSVHCKDARWAAHPGQEWGQEVPLGEGDVNFELFLTTLRDVGYDGPLTIEREIPQEPARQKEEIGRGIRLLNDLTAKLGIRG